MTDTSLIEIRNRTRGRYADSELKALVDFVQFRIHASQPILVVFRCRLPLLLHRHRLGWTWLLPLWRGRRKVVVIIPPNRRIVFPASQTWWAPGLGRRQRSLGYLDQPERRGWEVPLSTLAHEMHHAVHSRMTLSRSRRATFETEADRFALQVLSVFKEVRKPQAPGPPT